MALDGIPAKVKGWGIFFGILIAAVLISLVKGKFDDWSDARRLAKTETSRVELRRQNRERQAAIEAAKTPEQREADRLARVEQAKAAFIAAEKARDARTILKVGSVAGRAPSEVEAILGKPVRNETYLVAGEKAMKCFYKGGLVEIVYIHGKADWITLMFLGNIPMPDNSSSILELVGLPPREPSWESPGRMLRWDNFAGFRVINTGGTDGRAEFLLLCKDTTP